MGDRHHDFDAARAARRARPAPTILVFGEVVELPRAVPVALHLAITRLGHALLTPEICIEILTLLVGQDQVDEWLTHDLDEDDLIDLYTNARRIISERDDAEPDPGEAEAPETGAPQPGTTSSSDGGSSKPTSDASTASTSPEPSGTT